MWADSRSLPRNDIKVLAYFLWGQFSLACERIRISDRLWEKRRLEIRRTYQSQKFFSFHVFPRVGLIDVHIDGFPGISIRVDTILHKIRWDFALPLPHSPPRVVQSSHHTQVKSLLECEVLTRHSNTCFIYVRELTVEWHQPLRSIRDYIYKNRAKFVQHWGRAAIVKVAQIAVVVSIVPWKRARWTPFLITFLSSPWRVATECEASSEIYDKFSS